MGEGIVVFTDAHQNMGIRRFVETMELLREKELHPLTRAIYFCSSNNNNNNNNNANSHIECVYESIREGLPNVGQFLAWQVTCDLIESNCCSGPETRGGPQRNDKEREDFCKLGNGAKSKWQGKKGKRKGGVSHTTRARILSFSLSRKQKKTEGLELIFGKIPSCVELEKVGFLCSQQETVYKALGLRFPKFREMPLGLKNIEHALCEYSKYSSIQANCLRGYVDCFVCAVVCCCCCRVQNKTKKSVSSSLCSLCFVALVYDVLDVLPVNENGNHGPFWMMGIRFGIVVDVTTTRKTMVTLFCCALRAGPLTVGIVPWETLPRRMVRRRRTRCC